MASGKYELTFWGGAMVKFPRYRRWHRSYDDAVAEAKRVLDRLDNRAAHRAIVYGPDCGPDGRTIA